MIDWKKTEEKTGKSKEYFDKYPKSARLVYRICENCGCIRWVKFNQIRNLCGSCAQKSKLPVSNKTKQKIRNNHPRISGKDHWHYGKYGKGTPMYGKHHSEETKAKISNAKIGKKSNMENKHHTIESRIKISCCQQGIPIEEFSGFLINQKYCIKFNKFLKTKIRNQYNNCDYISGIHKDVCSPNRNLDIHHVNYDKNCGCDGTKCKLIPLSRSNHIKTNKNRLFWNRLFIYALEIDKWYYEVE